MTDIQDSIADFHCPRWEQLPAIPLYMDQVIYVVEEAVGVFADEKERVLTHAMVNNYVKQKLVPAPEKKRYTREHIAALIVTSVLKRVLPIGQIAQTVHWLQVRYGEQGAYDMFCETLEEMLTAAFATGVQTVGPVAFAPDETGLLRAALTALMGLLLAQSALRALEGKNADAAQESK
ncbi:DUF1836 domain-containing protein [Clostridia bacterium OttesenSCG-928-O13]|nr:DUF1836 domain-containing protein [Clostridia bacterium OttesenSCG-928-O13]